MIRIDITTKTKRGIRKIPWARSYSRCIEFQLLTDPCLTNSHERITDNLSLDFGLYLLIFELVLRVGVRVIGAGECLYS